MDDWKFILLRSKCHTKCILLIKEKLIYLGLFKRAFSNDSKMPEKGDFLALYSFANGEILFNPKSHLQNDF